MTTWLRDGGNQYDVNRDDTAGKQASWDVVVSYVPADQAWATWLTWQLQDYGLRVMPLAWLGDSPEGGVGATPESGSGTGSGSGAADVLREHAARSAHVIAVLSPAYLAATRPLWQDDDGGEGGDDADTSGLSRRLVPVRVEDCPRPGALGRVVSFDLFGLKAGLAGEWLRKQVGLIRNGDTGAGAGTGAERGHVPPPFPLAHRHIPDKPVAAPEVSPPRAGGEPATAGETGAEGAASRAAKSETRTDEPQRSERAAAAGTTESGATETGARDTAAGMVTAQTPGHVVAVFTGHKGDVRAVAFNAAGTLVATGGKDATVRLWELSGSVPNHRLVSTVRYGRRWNQEWVRAVAFAPSGHLLAISGDHYTTNLVDTSDRRRPSTIATLEGHGGYVVAAAFGADGMFLVTGSNDRGAIVWEVTIPQTPLKRAVLAGHRGAVTGVALTPDGRRVLTASDDATIGVWELTGVARPGQAETVTGHDCPVRALALSAQGTLLATGGKDGRILLWDATGTPVKITEMSRHRKAVHALAFSADGQNMISSDRGGAVLIWNVADPSRPQLTATLSGHRGEVSGVAFAPDGRHIATAGDKAVLWSLR